jgi:hypothetical protein
MFRVYCWFSVLYENSGLRKGVPHDYFFNTALEPKLWKGCSLHGIVTRVILTIRVAAVALLRASNGEGGCMCVIDFGHFGPTLQ